MSEQFLIQRFDGVRFVAVGTDTKLARSRRAAETISRLRGCETRVIDRALPVGPPWMVSVVASYEPR